ncbi:hypothetical protein EHS13_03060 [Paenibacillus psychroresistens]|uniref:YqbQ/XkdQ domain-containing protein n=1 Tax=Paenibacillus psychroresistens TaxID=1778678 RepID=A0A6B8RF25_9BACL|nr:hypothetical protein [Paenibacillus psychroresistens]QGQ93956.1 hypothetical protein EHS13_03060 [Paenibacillus psychroresistens]
MLEIIIDNRNGNLWDISGISSDASYKTSRVGKASSFEFTIATGGLNEDKSFKLGNGDVIRVTKDGFPLFYGYIFSLDSGRDEAVKVTAYDQIRYLMGNGGYKFSLGTAGDYIRRIAAEKGLQIGFLADTGHKIPPTIEDGTKLLDMICNAISKTLMETKRIYIFYDDFGRLMLRDMADWKLNLLIGDSSLVYDYKLKRSIDSETYNRIRLAQGKLDEGKRGIYIVQDSATIAQWGQLEYYQKIDDKMNLAQINQSLDNLLELKNRESRSFNIEALGDLTVRAGCSICINIQAKAINSYFLVEECTHKFDGLDHTMSLELRVYG